MAVISPRDSISELIGLEAGDGLRSSLGLLQSIIYPCLAVKGDREDGAWIATTPGQWQVATSDLFTVDPIEFPGGDIGRLAASGCINDLLASGARIRWATVGLHLSAALARPTLERVLTSFRNLMDPTGARVVCGDTKVHSSADPQMVIWVTAVGEPIGTRRYTLADARPGDELIVTGPLGAHAIAVLTAREGLGFERVVQSDVTPLTDPMTALMELDLVRCLRDLTRGGLLAGLWEGALATGLEWEIYEQYVPVDPPVEAASSLLGLDPMALTNEGCMLIVSHPNATESVLSTLQEHEATQRAVVIGCVKDSKLKRPMALVRDRLQCSRILPYPSGIGVPRLC